MYILLSILCRIISNFPVMIVLVGYSAYYSLGYLCIIDSNISLSQIKNTGIICAIISLILSIITTIFAWNHYNETISRGLRRWTSNLDFFRGAVGFSLTTFVEAILFYFLFLCTIVFCAKVLFIKYVVL